MVSSAAFSSTLSPELYTLPEQGVYNLICSRLNPRDLISFSLVSQRCHEIVKNYDLPKRIMSIQAFAEEGGNYLLRKNLVDIDRLVTQMAPVLRLRPTWFPIGLGGGVSMRAMMACKVGLPLELLKVEDPNIGHSIFSEFFNILSYGSHDVQPIKNQSSIKNIKSN